MIPLQWCTKKVKVTDLIELEFNPRKITEEKRKKLIESLDKFNLVEIPAVNTDMIVIGGNQRVKALILAGRGDEEIDVRFPNRTLTEIEVKEYNLISNSHSGEFDLDILLAEYSDIDFLDIGFDINKLEFENSELFGKSFTKFEKDKNTDVSELKTKEKLIPFAFSSCYSDLNNHGIPFFALFRNNEMDLDKLKSERRNIYPFVYPLINYFQEKGIRKLSLAPKGDRFEINDFHFVTELICEVCKIYPMEIFSPFAKNGNKIELISEAPEDTYLFDDILTFGTTIKRMNQHLTNLGVIILISNY